jgi:two-component system LytT family response regulator
MIDTVIVDDEPHARSLLRLLLRDHPDFEVVAEYGSGTEALRGIQRDPPGLVLLDIQMPGMTGMQVAEALAREGSMPALIFTTAFDEYAIQAFEINAADYLLKPISPARLERALQRVKAERSSDGASAQLERLRAVLDTFSARERRIERIAIRVGERTYLRRIDEIEWVEADGKHVKIHVDGKTLAIRETMKSMENRLDASRFVRVSRSAIVNLDRVREIQPWFRGDLVLILDSGAEVTTTRGFRDQLRDLVERGRE